MIRKTMFLFSACMLASSFSIVIAQPSEDAQLKERAPLEADSSVELVEFKSDSIAIKYPAGWEVITDVPKPRVLHVKTMGGKVNASLTVQDVPPGTTLEQYRDATTHDIENDAKDLSPKKVGEEKSHLGEIDAWKLVYSINVPHSEPPISAKQTLYLCVRNNRGYLLCCTAFDALPGKFDTVFRLMAETLKVESANNQPAKPL